jgi:hypothetical protein
MSSFRLLGNLISLLSVLFQALPARAFEFRGDYLQDGNQLLDQARVARAFGNPDDAWTVLQRLDEFRKRYSMPAHQSHVLALTNAEIQLRDFLQVQVGLRAAPPTEADASERILTAYLASEGVTTVPQVREPSRETIESSQVHLARLHERIAGGALMNALKTALALRKSYQKNFSPTREAIASEIARLCVGAKSCETRMRDWLQIEAEAHVRSEAFTAIRYRPATQVAAELNRGFAWFNLNHVLTSPERQHANLWKRQEKVSALYCDMMRAGGFTADADYQKTCAPGPRGSAGTKVQKGSAARYQALRSQYLLELKALNADQGRLRIYEPVIREAIASGRGQSGDELAVADRVEGMRYFCSQRMDLPGARLQSFAETYRNFQNGYLRIAGGPDGILLHTEALADHRLQADAWFRDARACPSEYALTITASRIKTAVQQALAETQAAVQKILEIRSAVALAGSSAESGAAWVRYFQPAVGKALVGFPSDVHGVAEMIRGLKATEKSEALRKKLVIGATAVASLPMLVIPFVGESGMVAVVTSTAAVLTVRGAIAGGIYEWWYQSREGRNLMTSIASGNADLAGLLEEVEIRNKIGATCRQLVLDLGFSIADTVLFFRSLKANGIHRASVQQWVAQARVNTRKVAQQLAKEPLKTVGRGTARIFVKERNLEAVLPEKKWGGILQESGRPGFWSKVDPMDWFQILPRRLTRYRYGKSYDLVPVHRVNELIERGILFKKPNLEFTRSLRFVVGAATFPATGFGLALLGSAHLAQKMELDREQEAAKYRDPELSQQFDYRRRFVKADVESVQEALRSDESFRREFESKYGVAPQGAANLTRGIVQAGDERGFLLGELLKEFEEQGFDYAHPLTLGALRGDPRAIAEVARVMVAHRLELSRDHLAGANAIEEEVKQGLAREREEELAWMVSVLNQTEFRQAQMIVSGDLLREPPENLILPAGLTLSDEMKNQIYRIEIEQVLAFELAYAGKLDEASKILKDGGILKHLSDAFITETLPQYLREGKTHEKLVPYHICNYLKRAADFEMLKVLGATKLSYEYVPGSGTPPRVRLTDQPESLEGVKRDILGDPYNENSVPNLLARWKEWESNH